ncbi:uncharacterized protein LOC123317456 [Coccinella septempunctata]|uniref:uncharacterized protein LOC123317456 n=1 Tax=Coccinella septempunctata TaxID=41139 RepID=UPI001D078119|nr:uncharacterized protein LOC123317456 [Coccinella septempunctata]
MSKLLPLLVLALVASFAASSIMREGRLSGAERMNEPEIKQCLLSKVCIITMDLTPTCASDGKTYPNRGSIDCLNECLKPEEKVSIVSGGYCEGDISN